MSATNRRILLVDDTPAIHEDFRKLLAGSARHEALDEMEAFFFGTRSAGVEEGFDIDSAFQGREAVDLVLASLEQERPYAMAFVDMRMPPGWDGIETIERMWQHDSRIQVVICTAFSDHSWDEVMERLDVSDRLLILKKPFDEIEVRQLATTLTAKWQRTQEALAELSRSEQLVAERTEELTRVNRELREDIAARLRAEAELRLAASVFHNTMDAIAIVDTRARILSTNPSFEVITGFPGTEVVGRSVGLLRGGVRDSDTLRSMQDVLAAEGAWQGEVWCQRRDGDSFLAKTGVSRVSGSTEDEERYVVVFDDITELRRQEEYIRHLAFHDPLTGLPNRALLTDRLQQGIALAEREGTTLGVLFVDLDRFKAVNDTFGHEVGNSLLRMVATRLRSCVRASDTVARIGGDEFVVLLPGATGSEECAHLAQRIIERLSAPGVVEGQALRIGASVGIACYPEDGENTVDLMKHADTAMYDAKSSGRGTFRFFLLDMTAKAERRLRLEMELRAAVEEGELELFYQPKVSMETGLCSGVEALLRWHHPTRGLVPPTEFIPVAEETGIICDLGFWVLDQACAQLARWRGTPWEHLRMSVNVSAVQLGNRDMAKEVLAACERHGVSPSRLEIELTESVVMADPEQISTVLSQLRGIGVGVAIDDFGTGYSSLAYLRRLPIDVLKIDRSFIMNVNNDDSDAEVVRTIIALSEVLNLLTVAEGVETESQADFLTRCGCATAQGYLFARPLPIDDLERWLDARRGHDMTPGRPGGSGSQHLVHDRSEGSQLP